MNEVKETLENRQCTLAVLHEGNICTFDGNGVRHLYHLINQTPEIFYNSKVAAKAVGKTAAGMMIEGMVSEVYADYISEWAYKLLTEHDIKTTFGKKLPHDEFIYVWKRLGEDNED